LVYKFGKLVDKVYWNGCWKKNSARNKKYIINDILLLEPLQLFLKMMLFAEMKYLGK